MPLSVNGELVDDAVIKEEERTIRPKLQEAMQQETPATVEARVREWARENVIERVVLRQAAIADQDPIPPEVIDSMVEEIRTQSPGESGVIALTSDETLRTELEVRYRVDRLLSGVTAKVAPPKNKDISDFYVKHRETFLTEERVHAAHIIKNVDESTDEATARAAIELVEQELKNGGDFATVADQHSDCPGRGGDLGTFPRGEMVPEFDAVVFSLEPGAVSGIFRSPFGFHIAKVHVRKPAGIRSLQEVREQIAEELLQEKRQKAVEQFLDRLLGKAVIETA